jgi:hypothetical protein
MSNWNCYTVKFKTLSLLQWFNFEVALRCLDENRFLEAETTTAAGLFAILIFFFFLLEHPTMITACYENLD